MGVGREMLHIQKCFQNPPQKKCKEEWLDKDLKVILVAYCTLIFI